MIDIFRTLTEKEEEQFKMAARGDMMKYITGEFERASWEVYHPTYRLEVLECILLRMYRYDKDDILMVLSQLVEKYQKEEDDE